jgi:multiple sugar transport system ATP-binding protein
MQLTAPARMQVKIDETVRFGWDPEKILLFDRKSGVNLHHAA